MASNWTKGIWNDQVKLYGALDQVALGVTWLWWHHNEMTRNDVIIGHVVTSSVKLHQEAPTGPWNMNTTWTFDKGCNSPSTYNYHCNMTCIANTGLKIVILSHDLICRRCEPFKWDQYYVWHNNGWKSHNMKKQAAEKGLIWYLREDWEESLLIVQAREGVAFIILIFLIII